MEQKQILVYVFIESCFVLVATVDENVYLAVFSTSMSLLGCLLPACVFVF